MAKTGYIFSEQGLLHDTGAGHPECPARLTAIAEAFAQAKLDPSRLDAVKASRADLLRVHDAAHIDLIEETCANDAPYSDPDTRMVAASWDTALLAAGGAIEACRAVLDGEFDNVFSAMRPPGHHAERDRAMGFCLFNNVAIAARWLREVRGLERVAILDWDVHHGNGTQHSLYDDPTILYVSLHQFPHYPGTGRPEERGAGDANLNLPMPPGATAEAWMDTFTTKAIPALESFDPEFLLISCGFDAHRLDPLAEQNLETHRYAEMTKMVSGLASGRIVSLLEGGYHLKALGESAVAHVQALQQI